VKRSKKKELTPLERTQQVLDISATERATFKLCRRKWELEVLNNLTPKTPPTFTYEFGTGIHRALEVYYSHVSNIPVYADQEKAYARPLKGALSEWDTWYAETETALDSDKTLDSTTRELVGDNLVALGDLGETMLKNYDLFSAQEDDFTVHAIEGLIMPAGKSWLKKHLEDREFVSKVAANGVTYYAPARRLLIPIIDPRTNTPMNGPVLSVRIDLLVHRVDPGMKGLWVYDHKTTDRQPSDRGLDFDDQVTAYCYAVYRWLGIIPRGFCVNYLLKQEPKEPRILSKGELSTAKDQLTTAEQYEEVMVKQGLQKSPKHIECLEALQSHGWDRFFVRHYVGRNKYELQNFERRLFEEWQDMLDCAEGGLELYPNMSKMHCPQCRVAPICQAIEDGSDWQAVMDTRYMQQPDRKASY
jgi:hypothetical protein